MCTAFSRILLIVAISPKANELCQKFFHINFVSITSSSFKIIYLFCYNLKFKFCFQSCDIIFPSKAVKIENKKNRIFWNTEFYHPAKFELKGIKNATVVARLQVFASCGPSVLSVNEQIHVRTMYFKFHAEDF